MYAQQINLRIFIKTFRSKILNVDRNQTERGLGLMFSSSSFSCLFFFLLFQIRIHKRIIKRRRHKHKINKLSMAV